MCLKSEAWKIDSFRTLGMGYRRRIFLFWKRLLLYKLEAAEVVSGEASESVLGRFVVLLGKAKEVVAGEAADSVYDEVSAIVREKDDVTMGDAVVIVVGVTEIIG